MWCYPVFCHFFSLTGDNNVQFSVLFFILHLNNTPARGGRLLKKIEKSINRFSKKLQKIENIVDFLNLIFLVGSTGFYQQYTHAF